MLAGDRQDAWGRTHPLTAQRVQSCATMSSARAARTRRTRRAAAELLRRIQVKLRAFLDPPSKTLAAYPESDNSVLARYARAIAYYRIPDLGAGAADGRRR